MYVVTKSGRAAWESGDAAVPEQYRLLLWRIDMQGDELACNALRELYPKSLVADWIGELLELGYIERGKRSDADITVPLEASAIAAAAGANAAQSLSSVGAYVAADSMPSMRGKKASEIVVLVVEDDPDQRALADLRVSMAGYQVKVAASVNELLWHLLNEPAPDILLLDVMLPDGNGFDVLSKLRRHPKYAGLAIILLTAVRDAEAIGKGLALGANGYVAKPYSRNVLARVIRTISGQAAA
jgi:two-component system, OmpR family, response regulator